MNPYNVKPGTTVVGVVYSPQKIEWQQDFTDTTWKAAAEATNQERNNRNKEWAWTLWAQTEDTATSQAQWGSVYASKNCPARAGLRIDED